MPLYDQHLHSKHSFDSKADPAANVESAIAKGLAGLTFTEHFDTHPEDWPSCIYDDESYSATIRGLRERYGGDIFVGKGIEVCFQPERMDFILDFLRGHRFDLVLLSVHYFFGKPVHRRENWAGVDAAAGTQAYLEHVREAVRFCEQVHRRHGRVFDVLGHLDVVKRYTLRYCGSYDVTPFSALIDDILGACLEAELVPEINTSSLRQGLSEPMPNAAVVARYASLGGTAMSLGSDSHRAEDIGRDFDRAVEMLRAAGIEHLAVYRNRVREVVPHG